MIHRAIVESELQPTLLRVDCRGDEHPEVLTIFVPRAVGELSVPPIRSGVSSAHRAFAPIRRDQR